MTDEKRVMQQDGQQRSGRKSQRTLSNDLWTAPIEQLAFEDVRAFCKRRNPEGVRIEYKSEFSSKKPGHQIAKEVCAFANTQGGLLLFGVAADPSDERRPDADPRGCALGDNPRDTIVQSCTDRIFPPLAGEVSDFLPNPDDPTLGFVVVRIAASIDAPHGVDNMTGIYVRTLDKAKRASLPEIEALVERRRTGAARQAHRVERGIRRLLRAMGSSPIALRQRAALPRHERTISEIVPAGYTGRPFHGPSEYVLAAIGPTIANRAVVHLKDLVGRRPRKFPPGQERTTDGVYYASPGGHEGWLADAFGNLVVLKTLEDLSPPNSVDVRYSSDWVQAKQSLDEQPTVIMLERLLLPVIQAVQAAQTWCETNEYFGLLTLRVEAVGLVEHPVIFMSNHWKPLVAANRTDDQIEVVHEVSSSEFGPQGLQAIEAVTAKLLWNWGSQEGVQADIMVDAAEGVLHGERRCPKCNKPVMPSNRTECISCRSRTE